jgi:hypothetical protein
MNSQFFDGATETSRLAVLRPCCASPSRYQPGWVFTYVLLVGKFGAPRSFGEKPIVLSNPINNDMSPDLTSSNRYRAINGRYLW